MRWTRRNQWWRPLARRLTAGLALTSYLVAVIGFPLPAAAAKDHSRRYPCENHACGCQTAEECWRHCCCFSPEAKLAWARANRVEPPAYAERAAAAGWNLDLGPVFGGGAAACQTVRRVLTGSPAADFASPDAQRLPVDLDPVAVRVQALEPHVGCVIVAFHDGDAISLQAFH